MMDNGKKLTPEKENEKHRDAFEIFYSLGDYISTRKKVQITAKEMSVAPTTIWQWKKIFKWDERKKKRDARIRERIERQTDNEIVQARRRYLDIVNKSIEEYETRIANGDPIKISRSVDLERFIKIALLLIGDVTERTEEKSNSNIELKKKLVEYEDYFAELERESFSESEVDSTGEEDNSE